ncbi:hypothetical protein [Rhizobium freirei]|uniref:hypothetical protein n=1 Tax=Rhizobium freirei TaxID=1353277 RepID=UPI001F0AEF23|nr:hypothetical protein [Rhizobium freirei]
MPRIYEWEIGLRQRLTACQGFDCVHILLCKLSQEIARKRRKSREPAPRCNVSRRRRPDIDDHIRRAAHICRYDIERSGENNQLMMHAERIDPFIVPLLRRRLDDMNKPA